MKAILNFLKSLFKTETKTEQVQVEPTPGPTNIVDEIMVESPAVVVTPETIVSEVALEPIQEPSKEITTEEKPVEETKKVKPAAKKSAAKKTTIKPKNNKKK